MSKLEGDFTPIHTHSKSFISTYEINNYNNKKKNRFITIPTSNQVTEGDNYKQNSLNNSHNIIRIFDSPSKNQDNLSNSVNLYNAPANGRGGIIVFPSTSPGKEYNTQLTLSKEKKNILKQSKINSLSVMSNNIKSCVNEIGIQTNEKVNNYSTKQSPNKKSCYKMEANLNFEILKKSNKWNKNNYICLENSSLFISKAKDNIPIHKNNFAFLENEQDYDFNDITIGDKYYLLLLSQDKVDYIKTNKIVNKDDFIAQYSQFINKTKKKPIVISVKQMSLFNKINLNENIKKINNDSFFINHQSKDSKCPYISHTFLFCNSIRPNKNWNSYEMFKENVERINYVVQKSIINRGYHYNRIKEVYDIEYDEPTNYPCLPQREIKLNWNKTNSITVENFEYFKPQKLIHKNQISSNETFCFISPKKKIFKSIPNRQKIMILWKNFDFCFLGTKTKREWIYDYNIFIYNEHNHNNTYYEKSYQLFTESELANDDVLNKSDYRSIYTNIPLSFTIMGKKPKKRYKISQLRDNNISYLPINYKTKQKNYNQMNIDNISLSYEKKQKLYEDKSTNEPLDKLKYDFYLNMIYKWKKNSIPLTQYSVLYKIDQDKIDYKKILKKWKSKLIPHKTLFYNITGKERRIWNDINIIESQFCNNFIQDKNEIHFLYIENKESMQLPSFKENEIAFEEKQKQIKEQCIKSRKEIEKMKKELLNNLNQHNNKEEEKKPKPKLMLKQKKKVINNHNELNKSANIPLNKETSKQDNEQLSKTNNMKSTILKEKKKNTSDNFFIGQSFNFNIYTKGMGVQSIKTSLPKENNNK